MIIRQELGQKSSSSFFCFWGVFAVFHKNQKQAGTLRTQLRTNQKAVVLKLGLVVSQQGSLTNNNFAAEPVSIFAPD